MTDEAGGGNLALPVLDLNVDALMRERERERRSCGGQACCRVRQTRAALLSMTPMPCLSAQHGAYWEISLVFLNHVCSNYIDLVYSSLSTSLVLGLVWET